jgi:hypothetical protein
MHPVQCNRERNGDAEELPHLERPAQQAVERLAAGVFEHQRHAAVARGECHRPRCPVRGEQGPERVFVFEIGSRPLPKGTGRELFRDRAQQLASELRMDAFVGAELGGLLLELYDLRSACVHGKVPFLDLQKMGDAGALRAGKLSFVAEKLARAALLVALRSDRVETFATREDLERAWKEGTFP